MTWDYALASLDFGPGFTFPGEALYLWSCALNSPGAERADGWQRDQAARVVQAVVNSVR